MASTPDAMSTDRDLRVEWRKVKGDYGEWSTREGIVVPVPDIPEHPSLTHETDNLQSTRPRANQGRGPGRCVACSHRDRRMGKGDADLFPSNPGSGTYPSEALSSLDIPCCTDPVCPQRLILVVHRPTPRLVVGRSSFSFALQRRAARARGNGHSSSVAARHRPVIAATHLVEAMQRPPVSRGITCRMRDAPITCAVAQYCATERPRTT
ncbi:hypothetical protein CC85DRAFT_125098 [Cutaneotrichosporon oleaginosum]|uniref:Uncharacterized protein n=1 Tax=Cutaneotrichosporon oleaginosum TaxID=879819 RepID=A0A0J0XJM9_9TREE|nr:uncharacterized protein CC85DRAFT_125098 [Cutaneotrichosporon oleaginosum]KLT41315.1 hypothetical protein CC85DRAFT_125098 [Cutaneotrichosporon oleaginosum]TXT14065.1 hypothetical protein COLE_00258 [Cutaneotrichosporon oleaginosum]